MTTNIDIIIEVPRDTNIKYEFDHEMGRIRVDRVLKTPVTYPGNYGYIPGTLSGDGDPLDAIVLCDYALVPTSVIHAKIIGVLLTEDEKGHDEKIIALPADTVDGRYSHISSYDQLPRLELAKLEYFFTHYKDMDPDRWVKVLGFKDRVVAEEIWKICCERAGKAVVLTE